MILSKPDQSKPEHRSPLATQEAAPPWSTSHGSGAVDESSQDLASALADRCRSPTPRQLRRALADGAIIPYYQPVVSLWDGAILGAEALARWRHPDRGILPPMSFVPLAEETGLVDVLGQTMLEQVCHDLAECLPTRNATGWPFTVSVNVSGRQLHGGTLAPLVQRLLTRHGTEPRRLALELTETALLAEDDHVEQELVACGALGVLLSLDDFGTGYSSLAQLERHHFDIVKIDRSFVTAMHDNPRRYEIVRAVISLARALGSDLIAEGVESEEEAEVLRSLELRRAQGLHYFRPMPLERLQGHLRVQLHIGS